MSIATAFATPVDIDEIDNVLPPHYVAESKELVALLRSYYEWMNKPGNPSLEINSLKEIHDIDRTHDKYLERIMRVFARSVPNHVEMDKRRLLKIIVEYYSTRGSDDSVHLFFKIFYRETIKLFFPKELLFESSSHKSASSGKFKIRDSYYYQEFSYNVKSSRSSREWKADFLNLVHPAGLLFFASFAIEMFAENEWYELGKCDDEKYNNYLVSNKFTWRRPVVVEDWVYLEEAYEVITDSVEIARLESEGVARVLT
jgi:hypothetical protein